MSSAAEPLSATRERILRAAEALYVLRGHAGFSFGDVAGAVGTTRANIHHHFGNKQRLMGELIEQFVGDAEGRIERIWNAPGLGFTARLDAQLADLRRFHDRFNPLPGSRNVWSPLARLRLDVPALGAPAVAALQRVDAAYESCLRRAALDAVAAGELVADTPVEDVSRLLRVTLMSCGPITQDSGGFQAVEQLFAALGGTLRAAWGPRTPA